MTVTIVQGDARDLPLPDGSVDLIVTSPPYWKLRSYRDGGEHYEGQLGSEPTPAAYIAELIACTREMMRVLKPAGSIFVNLGDKYATRWSSRPEGNGLHNGRERQARGGRNTTGVRGKSLLNLPARYAIACTDELGLIERAEVIWSKTNPIPESVTDRVKRTHEHLFHFVKADRYYEACHEIRERSPSAAGDRRSDPARHAALLGRSVHDHDADEVRGMRTDKVAYNPLGKLPGSVWDIWEIASQPLVLPDWLGIQHHAAFPVEVPRRAILGWSPPGICQECGEGRRPVAELTGERGRRPGGLTREMKRTYAGLSDAALLHRAITAYICRCTPFTDHPERRGRSVTPGRELRQNQGLRAELGLSLHHGNEWPARAQVREHHLDAWQPAPTRPGVVLDPFGGTGTVALVADVLGRHAITVDRSADYCRAARWRTTDPGQRALALQVPRPPREVDGQGELWPA